MAARGAGQMCRTHVTVSHAGFLWPITAPPPPTPPAGTNGNHVARTLIPEMGPGAVRRDGWQVCRAGRVIQYDAAAIRPVTREFRTTCQSSSGLTKGSRRGHIRATFGTAASSQHSANQSIVKSGIVSMAVLSGANLRNSKRRLRLLGVLIWVGRFKFLNEAMLVRGSGTEETTQFPPFSSLRGCYCC